MGPLVAYVQERWPQTALPCGSKRADSSISSPLNADPMPRQLAYEILGITPGTWHRLRRSGRLQEPMADRLATHLGLHPVMIWPSWFDDVLVEDIAEAS